MKNICHKIIINFLNPFSHSRGIHMNERTSIYSYSQAYYLSCRICCLSKYICSYIYYNIHLYLIKNVKCSRLFPLVFPLLFPVPKTLQHFPASSPRPENVGFKGAILDCLNVSLLVVFFRHRIYIFLSVCVCVLLNFKYLKCKLSYV